MLLLCLFKTCAISFTCTSAKSKKKNLQNFTYNIYDKRLSRAIIKLLIGIFIWNFRPYFLSDTENAWSFLQGNNFNLERWVCFSPRAQSFINYNRYTGNISKHAIKIFCKLATLLHNALANCMWWRYPCRISKEAISLVSLDVIE